MLPLYLWVPSSAQHRLHLAAYLISALLRSLIPNSSFSGVPWALSTFRSARRMQSLQSTAHLPSLQLHPLPALLESTQKLQVHPVVSRLCAPIDGTDPARLAHCLGLDTSRFHKQVQSSAAQAREEIQLTGTACCDDEDRYKVSL